MDDNDITLRCGDCGAHFVTSPSGSIDDAACSECGGKRFFRNQPSPTNSDGTLRDMVDSDSQKDQGGNPLGEGTIMGDDGEQSLAASTHQRDNFMHSHVHANQATCALCHKPIVDDNYSLISPNNPASVHNKCALAFMHNGYGPEELEQFANQGAEEYPNTRHPDPWMDNEPGSTTFPENWTHTGHLSHSMSYNRPETLNMEPYPGLWTDAHVAGVHIADILNDIGKGVSDVGNAIGDGAGAVAQGVADVATNPVVDAVGADALAAGELGMDPAADTAAVAADTAALGEAAPSIMQRAMNGVKAAPGAAKQFAQNALTPENLAKGVGKGIGFQEGENILGGGSSVPGGSTGYAMPGAPNQLQGLQAFGSTDIPALLMLADLETSDSVKSVDEQHDDPEDQDQKEFNDGDKSPSNLENPNNEDSGASGEDGAREADPGYGFGPDSPGIQRMMTLMPLLMHYIHNDLPGADDPLIQGLHEALESENPGYLDHEHPEGPKILELMIGDHQKKKKTSARLSLDMMPTPSSDVNPMPMPGTDITPSQQQQICPRCGAPLAADGSCPQCGYKAHPQGGNMLPTPVMANHQGPVNEEQKEALKQLIDTRPELFGDILHKVQNQPNSAPLVDSQSQDPAPPPAAPPGAGGAMPMPDPSQPGGGMQQPMQPMASQRHNFTSKLADANNVIPRCPKCHSATTSYVDGIDGDASMHGRCHSCQHVWKLPSKSSRRLVSLDAPLDMSADQQNVARPQETQQFGDVWKDADGNPLVEGQVYSLKSPQYPVPDEVEIVSKKPHELGVKLVGEFGDIQSPGDPSQPDFRITPQDLTSQKYTFEPSGQSSSADQGASEPPLGGTPGMEQIPEQAPTTDEISNSYPNRGTTSSTHEEKEDDEDLCKKCGNTWIHHTASSPTRSMHECARCGSVWETEDRDTGHVASANLNWIMESNGPGNDDFFAQYENARSGHTQGRNIQDIAAKDERLQVVRDLLSSNAEERARTAGRHFSPYEQRELINERGNARNADRLDLSGTHYETNARALSNANGNNVPDEHLIMGL